MKKYLFCALIIDFVSHTAVADERQAIAMLRAAAPQNEWRAETALKIDIDSDEKPDYVFLSQDQRTAPVGLVLGSQGNPLSTKSFSIGDPQQNGLCQGPATIEVETLDYLPYDSDGAVPGFERSKRGMSFHLAGGECD